ncbi:hypothetical protein G7054_g8377 [Neopestalotiopsis clavispora]|nr:hypothetical protein G7054_g8377 [Neopestalotiopsis clavispora]
MDQRPHIDPELLALWTSISQELKSLEDCQIWMDDKTKIATDSICKNTNIKFSRAECTSPQGPVPLVILQSSEASDAGVRTPGILSIHGGGMTTGTAYSGLNLMSCFVEDISATIISVQYRLAPAAKGLDLVQDCYSALLWVEAHLDELQIDPKCLMIAGISAGGGLAAGVSLMARDLGGPQLCAQLLICPMLDDRSQTNSAMQYTQSDSRTYDSIMNRQNWTSVLGEEVGGKNISHYIAPSRAENLAGLPPAYLDVGSAEPFRDEVLAYASKLWENGVQAEIHVWGGGFHAFDAFVPEAALSKLAIRTRNQWVCRMLCPQAQAAH